MPIDWKHDDQSQTMQKVEIILHSRYKLASSRPIWIIEAFVVSLEDYKLNYKFLSLKNWLVLIYSRLHLEFDYLY